VLEVNVPMRYHVHRGAGRLADGHSYAQVSRFLTSGVRALMDTVHAGPPLPARGDDSGSDPDHGRPERGGMESVDGFLAALWA
jgi:hypothetical protein